MNKYVECIEQIKTEINNYPLEITSGTKKMIKDYNLKAKTERNNIVENLIKQYQEDKEFLKQYLKEKSNQIFPETSSEKIKMNENKLELLRKVIQYNNIYNDIYDKSNYVKTTYNIDDIENSDLKEANNTLLYVINKFKKAGVRLTKEDFHYTMYTYRYMSTFFDKIEDESFDEKMASIFDNIYWNCPKLLTQLKLNIGTLLIKYKKEINNYCIDRRKNLFEQSDTNQDNYLNIYKECCEELENLIDTDKYLNTKMFLNNELNIDDYLVSSPLRDSKFSRFLKEIDFHSLSSQEKSKFYINMISLKNIINEVENYHLFEKIIEDIKERYKSKEKTKNTFISQLKEIKKQEKSKAKILKKFWKIVNKKKYDKSDLNVLINDINERTNHLEEMYRTLEESRINTKIFEHINEGSTIYDALTLASSFYSYMKTIIIREYSVSSIKQIDEIIDQLEKFVHNPNNVIIKKINLFSDIDLEYLIINKCQLLNINLEKEDLTNNLENLKKDIDMIVKIYNIEKSGMTLEDIKYICEVNKL